MKGQARLLYQKQIEELKKKKLEEKIKRHSTAKKHYLDTPLRKPIFDLLFTQGSICHEAIFTLPPETSKKICARIWKLTNLGYLKNEKTHHGNVFVLNDKYEEEFRKTFGDTPVDYYKNFVAGTANNEQTEMSMLTTFTHSPSSERGKLVMSESLRAYSFSYLRTFMYLCGFNSTLTTRQILHFQKEKVGNEETNYYSRYEILNDIKVKEIEQIYDDETERVRPTFKARTRFKGMLTAKDDVFVIFFPHKNLMKWYHSVEYNFERFMNLYIKERVNEEKTGTNLFVCYDNEAVNRILDNTERKKIMKELLYVDGLRKKEFMVVTESYSGMKHLREMTEKNWRNEMHKKVGLTFNEVKRANESYSWCDAIRHEDDKEIVMLNYLIPNLCKLQPFGHLCRTNTNSKREFKVFCYAYQRSVIDHVFESAKVIVEEIEESKEALPIERV